MDGRVCPDCFATVHGSRSQAEHRAWHLQINTLMQEFAKRTGLAEEEVPGHWAWVAEVNPDAEGELDANEAIEEG